MTTRRIPTETRVAILSAATRQAVEAMGSLDLAAQVTRAGRTQLGRCQSEHEDDTISLRDAEALDRAVLGRGGPFILPVLARLLNHVAIPMPEAPDDHDVVTHQLMVVTGELGDLSRTIVEALRDGRICAREARTAIERTDELLTAASALRVLFYGIAWPETSAPEDMSASPELDRRHI